MNKKKKLKKQIRWIFFFFINNKKLSSSFSGALLFQKYSKRILIKKWFWKFVHFGVALWHCLQKLRQKLSRVLSLKQLSDFLENP